MLSRILNYLILIFIGRFIVDLYLSTELTYMIHPRYIYFTLATAIITIIVGFIGIVSNYSQSKLSQVKGNYATNILKLFIVLILIYLPNIQISPLASATFTQRALDLNTLSMNEIAENELTNFIRNTENISLGEWVKAMNINPNLQDYTGKKVKVSGFVYYPPGVKDKFMISRFVITCCAVDARPVGIFVESSKVFTQDEWVEVKGEFELRTIDNEEVIVINAKQIEKIEIPDQPYIV